MSRVVQLVFHIVCDLADADQTPAFRKQAAGETEEVRHQLAGQVPELPDRLGARWTARSDSASGVRLTRVNSNSPVARAGIRSGDRIIRFADHQINSADDLESAVMLAGHEAPVVVQRPRTARPINLTVEVGGNPMRLGVMWRTDDAEPGTVILSRVAGRDFSDQESFLELVGASSDTLQLTVERDGRPRNVILRFPVERRERAA